MWKPYIITQNLTRRAKQGGTIALLLFTSLLSSVVPHHWVPLHCMATDSTFSHGTIIAERVEVSAPPMLNTSHTVDGKHLSSAIHRSIGLAGYVFEIETNRAISDVIHDRRKQLLVLTRGVAAEQRTKDCA